MDDDKQTVTAAVAPQEPEKVEEPEVIEDAQEEVTDTQPASEADVVESAGEKENDTTSSNWENDKKSMAEKIKALENRNNEYLERMKLLDALDSAASEDSEFMRMANKKLVEKGVLDESVLEEIGVTSQSNDGVTQDPAVSWARTKMQEERQKTESFFKDFEGRHPDISEGSPEIVRSNRTAIGAAAERRMKDGMSKEEAYEFAYKAIMNPTQLAEEGKLQGLAQAQSASPAEGAASGGVAKSSGGVELTPEQKDAARRFGVTEEAYAKSLE